MTQPHFVNDQKGNLTAVQIPIKQWDALQKKLSKYEQALKIKSDLKIAFSEVKKMQKGKMKKQTLSEALNEL